MKVRIIKQAVIFLVGALLSMPVAIVLTFMLSPFWNWFEAVSGIEALGHSGPAEWCFVAIYTMLVSVFVTYRIARTRRS